MAEDLEIGVRQEMGDVFLAARVEIVCAEDFAPLAQKPLAEVRAEKTGTAGDEDPFAASASHRPYYIKNS